MASTIPATAMQGFVIGSSLDGAVPATGGFGQSHTTVNPEIIGFDGNRTVGARTLLSSSGGTNQTTV